MQNNFFDFYTLFEESSLFWFLALTGTGMFLIQFVLNFFGMDDSGETPEDSTLADAGKFQWLTKHGLTGFLMMFGWAGLTSQNEFELPLALTLFIATFIGLFTAFVISFIFKMAKKLHSPGCVFNIDDTIGKEAFVYQLISIYGKGKITLSVDGITHELDAMTYDREDIASFELVSIIKKIDNQTVLVTSLKGNKI